MKAMLLPIMVAARIHVFVLAAHGAPISPDRITDSSHGGLMETIDTDFATGKQFSQAALEIPCQRKFGDPHSAS
jgi:hypothetical protein